MYSLEALDRQLFITLNCLHSPAADTLMQWITERQSWYPFYAIFIAWLFWQYRKRWWRITLYLVLGVTLSDLICSSVLKPLIGRLRPCHDPEMTPLVHLTGGCGGLYGFASSHAANTFAFAMGCYLLLYPKNKWIPALFAWATIVSYSRIYVGVHYPLDVLAGAGIGVLAALFLYHFIYPYYKPLSNKL